MTQVTNYAVANGPRADVRQAFNAILAALRDFNSGPTAPPNPVPGMPWLDTSTTPSTLRVRNDANSAWITAFSAWFSGDAAAARASLGLGSAALLTVGVASGNLAALGAGGLLDAARIPLSVGARHIRTVPVAGAVASVDFTSADMDVSKYSDFVIVTRNMIPVTNSAKLWLRTSTDGGATFASGAGSYAYAGIGINSTPNSGVAGATSTTQIELSFAGTSNNAASGGAGGEVALLGCDTPYRQKVVFRTDTWRGDAALFESTHGGGMRLADSVINGARIMFSSGNIAANANSSVSLYGVVK